MHSQRLIYHRLHFRNITVGMLHDMEMWTENNFRDSIIASYHSIFSDECNQYNVKQFLDLNRTMVDIAMVFYFVRNKKLRAQESISILYCKLIVCILLLYVTLYFKLIILS